MPQVKTFPLCFLTVTFVENLVEFTVSIQCSFLGNVLSRLLRLWLCLWKRSQDHVDTSYILISWCRWKHSCIVAQLCFPSHLCTLKLRWWDAALCTVLPTDNGFDTHTHRQTDTARGLCNVHNKLYLPTVAPGYFFTDLEHGVSTNL